MLIEIRTFGIYDIKAEMVESKILTPEYKNILYKWICKELPIKSWDLESLYRWVKKGDVPIIIRLYYVPEYKDLAMEFKLKWG